MLKHLIIFSLLLCLIGCDNPSNKSVKSPADKPALTKDKTPSQAKIDNSVPLLDTKPEKTIQPLNLQITSEIMKTIIDADKDVLKHTTEKPELLATKPINEQDRFNISFELYYEEDEIDYLNLDAIEGGKIKLEFIH